MSDLKTTPNDGDVEAFLNSVENEKRREDAFAMLDFMKEVTGEEPVLWGGSIVGFGSYHYKYASGREGDWLAAGFSPRKQALTLYIMSGFSRHDELMARLGTYTTGKSCLYVKKLEDVDMTVLEELVRASFEYVTRSSVDA
ncbi:MAG: DUF1801 domain-containing protein [Gemmatimonadetes bacterium]|nr:DUF1801 domain-containing protein [Gemmatimonadota bacterium]